MKTLLTAAAALLTVLAIGTQAQAYDGPSFSKCKIQTSGANSSLLIFGGSASRGTIKCKKTNGTWVKQNVVMPMGGVDLGFKKGNPLSLIARKCDMAVDITLVGAELNVNLTPTVINKLLRVMVVGEVVNPWKPNQTGAATIGINNSEFGVFAGLGTVTYAENCVQLASLKLGALVDAGKYDDRQAKIKARQEQMQNNR